MCGEHEYGILVVDSRKEVAIVKAPGKTRPFNNERLKAQMHRSGLTVPALATALDITEGSVFKWTGGSGRPSIDRILPLAEVLGCRVEELFDELESDQ